MAADLLQIGASIGVVEISQETESVATLLSAADVACYSAKDGGRNRVFVYDDASATTRHKEMRWVSRLTCAADDDKLQLVFQPIVPVQAGAVDRPRYELLLRLSDEQAASSTRGSSSRRRSATTSCRLSTAWVVEARTDSLGSFPAPRLPHRAVHRGREPVRYDAFGSGVPGVPH